VAIVTGGSAGIGRAIARSLHAAGHRVFITGRDRDKAAAAAGAIAGTGGPGVVPMAVDAGDVVAMRALVTEVVGGTGRLDVLVNNAGIGELIPIAETSEAALTRMFRANVFGPAAAIAAAWPTLVAQRRGCIVNISSWAALDPFPGFLIYGATKSALNSMTRSVWNEGRDHGIRPFTIGPGAVETDLLRSAFDESMLPRSACLAPEDIADLALACIEGKREDALGRCLYIRRDAESGAVVVEMEAEGPTRQR